MEPFTDDRRGLVVTEVLGGDQGHVKVVMPSQINGHQLILPQPAHRRSGSPKTANKKPAFSRDFKQAVFQNRGREDGSSNLHVTFTSTGSKAADARALLTKQLQESRHFVKPAIVTVNKPIKPKPAPVAFKDMVAIDKRKMIEEIESIPKPEHLVEAEKELLSYGSIKTFSPTWTGDTTPHSPIEIHACVGCENVFPSQYSLLDHMNRQSYQLIVDCPQCAVKFEFTNKCRMYEHMHDKHSMNREQAVQVAFTYSSLQVLPRVLKLTGAPVLTTPSTNTNNSLEDGLTNGVKMESAETIEDTAPPAEEPVAMETTLTNEQKDVEKKEEVDQLQDRESKSNNEKEPLDIKPIIINGTDDGDSDEVDDSISCTECSETFETEWTLQTHFSLTKGDNGEPEVCIPCRVELPTPCARKAHMRVHGLTEPFVCPDCGQLMHKKTIFLKHLRLHCLHYSKLSEFTCPSCSETFSSADEQVSHLKMNSSHLRFEGERSYYKCNGCPKAFKSVVAHSKHESCPGAGCTVVHMCNNCPQQTVFRSWTELTEHRSKAHPDLTWKPKRTKLFGCYLCVHKTKSKQGLLEHLQKSHSKKKIDYMCQYCGVEPDCRQSLLVHRETCVHKDALRGCDKAPLPVTSSSERGPRPNLDSDPSTNAMTPEQVPASVTPLSATASSTSTTSPTAVTTPAQDIPYMSHTTSFNCHICTAQCSSYNKLREHVTQQHGGRGLIYECWLCKDRGNTANFYRQAALDKHMTDTHKIQINSPVPPDGPDVVVSNGNKESDSDEVPVKRMRIWTGEDEAYQCCRCDYSTTTAEDFKQHIKDHKTSNDCHQCAECGMCFTVQLGLKRHLFAVHKVTDYAKYSRSLYMAEYEKQLHDTQGKCPVCKKEFEDEMLLRKHLRVHGMMYINTRRLLS